MGSITLATKEARLFWGEFAPAQHFVQFYEDDDVLLDTLTGFVAGGLTKGDGTIIIATAEHLRAITQSLVRAGVDLARVTREDRFITLDTEIALTSFMVGDVPDEQLFATLIQGLLRRVSRRGRHVRAFGEMVAQLWARGLADATLQLEVLWQEFCDRHSFSLFCAYPKAAFTKESGEALAEICAAHSKVIC
jgi:hypothetical protein